MGYHIVFDDDFEKYEWEIESKGWFDAVVRSGDSVIKFSFYDPVRLSQEVESAIAKSGTFFEKNIVVIAKVNRSNMEKSIECINVHGHVPTA